MSILRAQSVHGKSRSHFTNNSQPPSTVEILMSLTRVFACLAANISLLSYTSMKVEENSYRNSRFSTLSSSFYPTSTHPQTTTLEPLSIRSCFPNRSILMCDFNMLAHTVRTTGHACLSFHA